MVESSQTAGQYLFTVPNGTYSKTKTCQCQICQYQCVSCTSCNPGYLTYSGLADYQILDTLGDGGHGSVVLARHKAASRLCAIKLFNNPTLPTVRQGVEAFIALNKQPEDESKEPGYRHIVKMIEYIEDGRYSWSNGSRYLGPAIVMELASNGDLYEYIAKNGPFPETLARTFFRQLITALEFCHNRNYAHRNLKADNLLLDKDYILRVGDLGCATPMKTPENPEGLFTGTRGTAGYRAPEMSSGEPYDGRLVDVYASGVLLFIMMSGSPPYQGEEIQDKEPWFKCLVKKQYETFWKLHSRNKLPGFYSEDFKNLIQSMIALNPAERVSLAGIKDHPWYKGPIQEQRTVKEVFLEAKRREEERLNRQRENQRKRARPPRNEPFNEGDYSFYIKHMNEELTEDMLTAIDSELEQKYSMNNPRAANQYEKDAPYQPLTEMFVVIEIHDLFRYMVRIADKKLMNFLVSKDEYKIEGIYLGDSQRFELTIEILKVDEEMNCIRFQRKSGEAFAFYEMVGNELRKPVDWLFERLGAIGF